VLSGRGLCDELITRPEESYQLWCVVVCDLETPRMGAPYIYDISTLRVKNYDCSLWFYIRFWLPAAAMAAWELVQFPVSHLSGRQPKTYVNPEAAITVFELLTMGGVSPETCLANKKHWNNRFYYTVASCWFFLYDLSNRNRIAVPSQRVSCVSDLIVAVNLLSLAIYLSAIGTCISRNTCGNVCVRSSIFVRKG